MDGGITGRAPVASTIWSAVIRLPSSMASSCGPVKRARPSISVTWSGLGPEATALGRDRVGLVEDPVPDGGPVHAGERGLDPELGCAAYLVGDVRGVHEHLARDAASVEAGAAEGAGLDQRDRALRGQCLGHQDVAGSGTDDDQRKVSHFRRLLLKPGFVGDADGRAQVSPGPGPLGCRRPSGLSIHRLGRLFLHPGPQPDQADDGRYRHDARHHVEHGLGGLREVDPEEVRDGGRAADPEPEAGELRRGGMRLGAGTPWATSELNSGCGSGRPRWCRGWRGPCWRRSSARSG